jgi:methionyl-tRNA synthetase
MKSKFYITTAIAYVNADPHIGFALELLYADVLARYHRMHQDAVFFLTGTDEHGSKIARAAENAGLGPQAFVDRTAARFELLADTLNVSNDSFVRTSSDEHHAAAQAFWKRSLASGKIYKKAYAGLYCVGCEAFKTAKELVDGTCPDHHITPEPLEEENYFFRLTDFRAELERLYHAHPGFVVPSGRFNEVKEWLNTLEDVSISRAKKHLTWGIPVPDDPEQVMYVWFDALINYLSAIGYPDAAYHERWPADVHIIGKEISRFHAVLWPAMLIAAGEPPPGQIAVHGHISVEGRKMSKSLGNVIDPFALVETYGVDPTRYFLLREIPFSGDGDFSDARMRERYTGDLANGVGNLVSRVLAMVEQYEKGIVPAVAEARITPTWRAYEEHMAAFDFHLALADVWDVIGVADKLINDEKPWELAKGDRAALSKLLYILVETLRHVALMLWPFLPETAERILSRLDAGSSIGAQPLAELQTWGLLKPGTLITRGEALFPRRSV